MDYSWRYMAYNCPTPSINPLLKQRPEIGFCVIHREKVFPVLPERRGSRSRTLQLQAMGHNTASPAEHPSGERA